YCVLAFGLCLVRFHTQQAKHTGCGTGKEHFRRIGLNEQADFGCVAQFGNTTVGHGVNLVSACCTKQPRIQHKKNIRQAYKNGEEWCVRPICHLTNTSIFLVTQTLESAVVCYTASRRRDAAHPELGPCATASRHVKSCGWILDYSYSSYLVNSNENW